MVGKLHRPFWAWAAGGGNMMFNDAFCGGGCEERTASKFATAVRTNNFYPGGELSLHIGDEIEDVDDSVTSVLEKTRIQFTAKVVYTS